MRAIRKAPGYEPQELADFKAAANEDWTPTYDKLTSVEKSAIRGTIKALALHVDKLRAARAAAIGAALDELEGLSDEEARRALAMYEAPDAEGRLFPFCFAISAVLRRYVPDGPP